MLKMENEKATTVLSKEELNNALDERWDNIRKDWIYSILIIAAGYVAFKFIFWCFGTTFEGVVVKTFHLLCQPM